jgi:hypothetical protein
MAEKRRAKRRKDAIKVATVRGEAYHSVGMYDSMGVDGCWQRRALKGGG